MGKRKMNKKNMTVADIINKDELKRSHSLTFISRKEKEKMLYLLRKINEDYNKLELIFISEIPKLSSDIEVRIKQLIDNNKIRVRNLLWSLTGTPIKNEVDDEEFKEIINK
jgi:hypothetical protein